MTIKAIETRYAGIQFRSRLEAKWAAFFTRIGWAWEYEPFDGNGYIPDFLIHGKSPFLVEVKPAVTAPDYYDPTAKISRGMGGAWDRDILVVGASPYAPISHPFDQYSAAGVLGEWHDGRDAWDQEKGLHDGPPGWSWEAGLWNECGHCGLTSVFHAYMSYHGRPCGCHDGDHYLQGADHAGIAAAWADATNTVRWAGR